MKNRILELIDEYKDYPEETVKELISSSVRVEYATAGTGYLEGYYCPRRIELFVSGCKRGKLIKKPGKHFDGYKYYFSADNEILLIDTFCSRELMIREGDYVYGIRYWKDSNDEENYEKYHPEYITAAHYKGDLIRDYTECSVLPVVFEKGINSKNVQIHTDYQEYIYSDEPVPSIKEIICEYRVYSSSDGVENIISAGKYDVVRINESRGGSNMKTDKQNKLTKKLEKKIKKVSSLEQAVKEFFVVVAEASPNDEEMLLYEVGCYQADDDSESCMFCLVRQTPSEDGEYYQMHLELQYEADDEIKSLKECEWHEKGDSDLYEYVTKSKAYQTLKERTYNTIRVWVDET